MKKRSWVWLIVLLIILIAIIFSYGVGNWIRKDKDSSDNGASAEVYCESDADCVPSECCHPSSCATKGFEEDCSGIYCTQECAPETLDCGQGSCGCVNKKCKALINSFG